MSHTRIYVGRLNHRTRERDLEDLFSQYGKVLSCDIKNGLGFGFVEFEDYRDAEDAVRDLDGKEVDGSRITVEFSKSSRRGGSSSGGSSSSSNNRYGPPQRSEYRCVVDCLPRDMSWQDLKDHFRKVSDVIYADVWQDRGRGKGAVEFRSREDMKKAIKELDATEVRGSKIYVEEDEDRQSRSYNRGSRYSRRRSYSRSRSPPRRRSRRSRSRSKSRSRSRSRSRSDSKDRKRGRSPSPVKRRGRSPSPTKSLSPAPKGSISPKGKRSPRYERNSRSRSRSGSRGRDRSRGRSLSRSPPPHKRSRSPSPERESKRQKVEEQEETAD